MYTLSRTDELFSFIQLLYLLAQRIKDEGPPPVWDMGFAAVGEWARKKGFITTLVTSQKNKDITRIPEVVDDRLANTTSFRSSSGNDSKKHFDWPSVKKTELPEFGIELDFTHRDASTTQSCESIRPVRLSLSHSPPFIISMY